MSNISVVVVTENAQDIIEDCLSSAKWAGEIVIVDVGSSDKTIEIASRYTDKIIKVDKCLNSGQIWNQGISAASKDWIFLLESDKRIPIVLKSELDKLIKQNKLDDVDGYFINTRNYFLDHWIKMASFYPDPKLYLFRKGTAEFEERHKGCVAFKGKAKNLEGFIEHYVYRSLGQCSSKINKESDKLAEGFFNKKIVFKKRFIITKPLRMFKKQYFRHRGSKEGLEGLLLSFFSAFESFFIYAKRWEIEGKQSSKR
ncbi:MAG: glycosyltransferase family 2 protein [Candidatus Omnitrophica bacterium]|nr:glycosyltransferase family 2 protein [Candidatus Omnitrophota bacterium]MBU2266229.1 glycosyltransferase family 2 protein [Candidatus Omnitrophota bacterium]